MLKIGLLPPVSSGCRLPIACFSLTFRGAVWGRDRETPRLCYFGNFADSAGRAGIESEQQP